MDQEPPVRRNTFVLVAVVLFNLIWITLLFLSCQADKDLSPTPTPEASVENRSPWNLAIPVNLTAAPQKEVQPGGKVDCVSQKFLPTEYWTAKLDGDSVPFNGQILI